jgi:uncharacterized membrane-anchored protein
MDWKEFFRPSLKKIIVAIIIVVFEFVMFLMSGFGVMCKEGGNCFSNWYNRIAAVLSIHTYFFVAITESLFNNPIINAFTIIIVNLIVGYLVSCLFFHSIEKIKK